MFKELSIVLCTMSLFLLQDIISVPLRNNDQPITQWSGQINGFDIDRPDFATGGTDMENGNNGMGIGNLSNSSSGWINGVTSGTNNGMGSVSNSSSGWISQATSTSNNAMENTPNSSNGWVSNITNGSNGMESGTHSGNGWDNGFASAPNHPIMGTVSNSSSGWINTATSGSSNGMENPTNGSNNGNSGNGWGNGWTNNGMGSNNIMRDEQWGDGFSSMSWSNRTNGSFGSLQNRTNKYSGYPSMYYQQYSQSFIVPTQATVENLQNETSSNTSDLSGQNGNPPPDQMTNQPENMGNNPTGNHSCEPESSDPTVSGISPHEDEPVPTTTTESTVSRKRGKFISPRRHVSTDKTNTTERGKGGIATTIDSIKNRNKH